MKYLTILIVAIVATVAGVVLFPNMQDSINNAGQEVQEKQSDSKAGSDSAAKEDISNTKKSKPTAANTTDMT